MLYGDIRDHSISSYEVARLLVNMHQICILSALSCRQRTDSPTCSFPLKTYKRQPFVGFRASGGSLYLSTTPLNVFVSAASLPELAKFGPAGGSALSRSDAFKPGAKEFCEGRGDRERRFSRLRGDSDCSARQKMTAHWRVTCSVSSATSLAAIW